jgi:hypothetical protein
MGTPDSNGQLAKFTGRVFLQTICNPPAPNSSPPCSAPGEQGDVRVDVNVTDVRRQSDLSDYSGEIQLLLQLRITDKMNGAFLNDAGTAADTPLSIPVPCTPTSDPAVGSSCNVATTADSVVPGVVLEAKRTIWELDRVEVFDGGADGDADTSPNMPYLRQGFFAP